MRKVNRGDEFTYRIIPEGEDFGAFIYRGNPDHKEEVREGNRSFVKQADPKVIWGGHGYISKDVATDAIMAEATVLGIASQVSEQREKDNENNGNSGR